MPAPDPRLARPIVLRPDPVLARPAADVVLPDPDIAALVEVLHATMVARSGLGLAAPQLGVGMRVAVVNASGSLLVLLNPVIVRTRGRQEGWEGCLSVPNLVAEVDRPDDVTVETLTLDGRRVTHRGRGLVARAIAHEVDHLAGRLFVDLVPADALVDTREHPTPPPRSGAPVRSAPSGAAARATRR